MFSYENLPLPCLLPRSYRRNPRHHRARILRQGSRLFRSLIGHTAAQPNSRKAFLTDMTGHSDPEPESMSVEIQGHFIPIY